MKYWIEDEVGRTFSIEASSDTEVIEFMNTANVTLSSLQLPLLEVALSPIFGSDEITYREIHLNKVEA